MPKSVSIEESFIKTFRSLFQAIFTLQIKFLNNHMINSMTTKAFDGCDISTKFGNYLNRMILSKFKSWNYLKFSGSAFIYNNHRWFHIFQLCYLPNSVFFLLNRWLYFFHLFLFLLSFRRKSYEKFQENCQWILIFLIILEFSVLLLKDANSSNHIYIYTR